MIFYNFPPTLQEITTVKLKVNRLDLKKKWQLQNRKELNEFRKTKPVLYHPKDLVWKLKTAPPDQILKISPTHQAFNIWLKIFF